MEPKFTPGPWEVAATADDLVVKGRAKIASTYPSDGDVWGNANAHLISAAPDLYAALAMAQLWLDVDGRFDMRGINAALAKARGEA